MSSPLFSPSLDYAPSPALSGSPPPKTIPAWAVAGAVSRVAYSMPKKGFVERAAVGALKFAAATSIFGAIFFVASAWGLHKEMREVRQGHIDLSPEAVKNRALSGSLTLPLAEDELNRYAEATLYSSLAYKADWKKELEAGAPHAAIRPVSFHPELFGGFEKRVSAMRVVASAPPERSLVVSFSGSDDLLDFVRDSNGFGLLSSFISPRTSFKELEAGVQEALGLISKTHGDYDRIIIVGHSLGGHLANEFARRLARQEGSGSPNADSPILSKTELLTLNTVYLDAEEPAGLARVHHFRESHELTDRIGRLSGLRAPSARFVKMVSAHPVADAALAEQMSLNQKIALNFSPFDLFKQIEIVFSYGIERFGHMVDRHLGRTAQLRIQDALDRSALMANASANEAARAPKDQDFAPQQALAWTQPHYACNTLCAPDPAIATAVLPSLNAQPMLFANPFLLAAESASADTELGLRGPGRFSSALRERRSMSRKSFSAATQLPATESRGPFKA